MQSLWPNIPSLLHLSMPYHKFQASQLFTGTEMLGPDAVLILDERGYIEAIVKHNEAGEDVQQLQGVLSPGFINCHCHLELSHMRGLIPEKTGLVDFVFKVVNERHFPDEEILDAIAKAEDEMLLNGIVAVGDICNNTMTLAQKEKQRLAYYNFIEVSGWLPAVAQTRFDRSMAFLQAFAQTRHLPLTPHHSLSPHAPYSVSQELWELMRPFFPDKTVTIHNQETAFEDALFQNGGGDFMRMYEMMKLDTSFFTPTGKSSLQSFFTNMHAARQVLLVHNTFTGEEDLRFVNQQPATVNWCICINANQYIEEALPPIDLFRKNNCRIVVGTDSLASNHSLSILDELKTITRHFPSISLKELLQWATLNGARALQMDNTLGSFEKGKQPGVVLLSGVQAGVGDGSCVKRLR